jgi:hypothetical protein
MPCLCTPLQIAPSARVRLSWCCMPLLVLAALQVPHDVHTSFAYMPFALEQSPAACTVSVLARQRDFHHHPAI